MCLHNCSKYKTYRLLKTTAVKYKRNWRQGPSIGPSIIDTTIHDTRDSLKCKNKRLTILTGTNLNVGLSQVSPPQLSQTFFLHFAAYNGYNLWRCRQFRLKQSKIIDGGDIDCVQPVNAIVVRRMWLLKYGMTHSNRESLEKTPR